MGKQTFEEYKIELFKIKMKLLIDNDKIRKLKNKESNHLPPPR